MGDGVARALLSGNLNVSVAVVTDTAREARRRHGLAPVSASLLAQGLTGGLLLASLQKGESRVNLQLECDGPFRGFFVDAGANGTCRGYAKNTSLDLELEEGPFRWRAALGNSGFLSVLRDQGVEFYRSSVQLEAMNVGADLNHYFTISDQVLTCVALEVIPREGEALGVVAGVVVQAMPDAEPGALARVAGHLQGMLLEALPTAAAGSASHLLTALFPGVEAMIEVPASFACSCSKERVLKTLASLGAAEVQEIVDTTASTSVTCHFCGTKHEITLLDLWAILESLGVPQHKQ
jgi:molecular chaperone Hsp33